MYAETQVTLDEGDDHKYNRYKRTTRSVGVNLKGWTEVTGRSASRELFDPTLTLVGEQYIILL